MKCDLCSMVFRHKHTLIRHLAQHSGERPFRCQICNTSFTNVHKLREHSKKKHPQMEVLKKPNNSSLTMQNQKQFLPILPKGQSKPIMPNTMTPVTYLTSGSAPMYLLAPQQTFSPPVQYIINNPIQPSVILPNGFYSQQQQPIYIQPSTVSINSNPILSPPNTINSVEIVTSTQTLPNEPEKLSLDFGGGETVKFDILERAILEISDAKVQDANNEVLEISNSKGKNNGNPEGQHKDNVDPVSNSTNESDEPFECEDCGRRYKFENFLKVHQRRPCKV